MQTPQEPPRPPLEPDQGDLGEDFALGGCALIGGIVFLLITTLLWSVWR